MEVISTKEKDKHSVEGKKMGDDDFLAMQERITCLELYLENMKLEIEVSQLQKSNLQKELLNMKESLEEKIRNSIDHELNCKHLKEQLESAKQETDRYKELYHSKIEDLQIALKSKDTIQNELHDVKEAEDVLIAELQLSKQKIEELEQELVSFINQAQKSLGLQKLLEQEHFKTKELEHQIKVLQKEMGGLHEKYSNNEQEEDPMQNTLLELFASQDEVGISRNGVEDPAQHIASSKSNNLHEVAYELENRPKLSTDKHGQLHAQLDEALNYSVELEKKVNSLQDLLNESETRAKNSLELHHKYQGMLQASDAAKHTVELKFGKIESELTSLEKKNLELQEELICAEEMNSEKDRIIKGLQARTFEMSEMLWKAEEEDNLLKTQVGEHKQKIVYLESALNLSSLRAFELEEKLKLISENCAAHETQSTLTNQRNLELEDQIQASHLKTEDARRCVTELQLLLQISEQERYDLEQHCRSIETKYNKSETESKQYSRKLSEVSTELQAFLAKIFDLEVSLQHAKIKEMELVESLKEVDEGRDKSSDEIRHLESSLDVSNLKIKDLRNDIRTSLEGCLQHESPARLTPQHSTKLEDMMHTSHYKAEYSERNVIEQEMFPKVSEEKRDLEGHLRSVEMKFLEAKEASERYVAKFSSISEESQASQEKVSTLELLLNDAETRETELKESPYRAANERTNYMDKIEKQESETNQLASRNLCLEPELKITKENSTNHDEQTNAHCQRYLELEGIIQLANSKDKDPETKIMSQDSIISKLSQDKEDCQVIVSSLELTNKDELKLEDHLDTGDQEKFKKEKIKQLEFNLDMSSMRMLELEKELEIVREKFREEQDLASMHQQRCLELEIQNQIAESKTRDAKIECKSYASKVFKLTDDLETYLKRISRLEIALHNVRVEEAEAKENVTLVITEKKYFEDKIRQLENELEKLSTRNMEIEQELKVVLLKYKEHERQASLNRQRSLHLEDMIPGTQFKGEDTDKNRGQLELLLKDSEQKRSELEMQLHFARSECKKHSDRLSELTLELEVSLVNASTLEVALTDANKTKGDMRKAIHLVTQEKKRFEDASNDYGVKLSQMENLLDILQHELAMTQQKLVLAEERHQISLEKESELLNEAKVLEDQLDHKKSIIGKSGSRFQKPESISTDSKQKLQEPLENITMQDSEADKLLGRVIADEKPAAAYQEQRMETSYNKHLQSELEDRLGKLISLEEVCDQLEDKLIEGENKENAPYLVEATKKLKLELEAYLTKVRVLEQMLQSTQDQKEATIEETKIPKDKINESTDNYARTLKLCSVAEHHIADTERKLQEPFERYKVIDSDAEEMHDNSQLIEYQLMCYKDKTVGEEKVIETQNIGMEEAFSKFVCFGGDVEVLQSSCSKLIIENEALTETKQKLSQELVASLAQISDLQGTLMIVREENNETAQQLTACKKTINYLIEQHKVENQKSNSQFLQNEMESGEELERKSSINNTLAELEAKPQQASLLEKQVEEHKQHLKQYDSNLKEKEENIILLTRELDELRTKLNQFSELVRKVEFMENELKSERLKFDIQVKEIMEKKNRDLHIGVPVEASALTGLKLILVVAVVSLLMGIFLGKRN